MPALTIRNGLMLASVATLSLSAGAGYVAPSSIDELHRDAGRLYVDILPGVEPVAGMNAALGEVRLAEAGYLTIADPTQAAVVQAKVSDATETFEEWVSRYAATIPAAPTTERADFESKRDAFQQNLAMSQRVAEHAAKDEMAEASALYLVEMEAAYAKLGEALDALVAYNNKATAEVNAESDAAHANTLQAITLVVGALCLIALCLFAYAMLGVDEYRWPRACIGRDKPWVRPGALRSFRTGARRRDAAHAGRALPARSTGGSRIRAAE